MRFKGPRFPSFDNQQTPAPRNQWIAHNGRKAQLRNLRHACRPILESTNQHIVAQVARVIAATEHEPMPEFGKLHLIFAAIDACDQTGEPWWVCMKYMLDKWEDMKNDRA